MNILMITINDPAGTAIAFTNAINKYTEHTCRLITKEIRYNFMFEKDLHLPWLDEAGWVEVEQLLRTSDVFHFHMAADEDIELGPFRPADYMKGKIIVHHHHGHPDFRGNPEKYRQKYRERGRTNLLVSTPDLLKLLPEAKWQPNLVPIDDPDYLPVEDMEGAAIHVCHAPTRKDLKNTSEFLNVMSGLQTQIPGLSCRLIENIQHRECLRIKRQCQIHFDHMQGYFGVSSLESLSQGKPVIAGLDEWNIGKIREFAETESVPWIIARNTDELKSRLMELVENTALRQQIGMNSRRFMEHHWNEKRGIELLRKVYAEY